MYRRILKPAAMTAAAQNAADAEARFQIFENRLQVPIAPRYSSNNINHQLHGPSLTVDRPSHGYQQHLKE
jgi:hypothetical protein